MLVGREHQRSLLIRLLFDARQRTSVLVTGRRGVGKTTFVEHCLREYEGACFRRFVRSEHGNSVADLLMIVVFCLIGAALSIMIADVLQLLTPKIVEQPILLVLLLPAAVLCLLPLLGAWRVTNRTLRVWTHWQHGTGLATTVCLGLVAAGLVLAGLHATPALALSRFLLALGVLCLIGEIGSTGRSGRGSAEAERSDWRRVAWAALTIVVSAAVLALGLDGAWNLAMGSPDNTSLSGFERVMANTLGAMLLVAFAIFARGWRAMRYAGKCRSDARGNGILRSEFRRKAFVHFVTAIAVCAAFAGVAYWALPDGLSNWNSERVPALAAQIGPLVAAAGFGGCLVLMARRRNSEPAELPPSLWLPIGAYSTLKSAGMVLVTLHLGYGLYEPRISSGNWSELCEKSAAAQEQSTQEPNSGSLDKGASTIRTPESPTPAFEPACDGADVDGARLGQPTLYQRIFDRWMTEPEAGAGSTVSARPYFTLFAAEDEEAAWIALFVFVAMLVFFIDYEWINRPAMALRDPRALDPSFRREWRPGYGFDPMANRMREIFRFEEPEGSDEPDGADTPDGADGREGRDGARGPDKHFERLESRRREAAGWLEETTVPYYLARVWMTSLIVRINLGFDQLDHRGVTLAMLTGLRNDYRRLFFGWSTPFTAITYLLVFLAIALATTHLSRTMIDFPAIEGRLPGNPSEYVVPPDGASNVDTPPRIAYCRVLLETLAVSTPERGAMLPRTLCEVVPTLADRILPIAFAPLLEIDVDLKSLQDHLLFSMLHRNHGLPQLEPVDGSDGTYVLSNSQTLSFRVYHLILFALLYALLNRFLDRSQVLPYRHTMQSLERLIEKLTTQRRDTTNETWLPAQGWLSRIVGRERTEELTREALDPRVVESELLAILDQMQASRLRLPVWSRFAVSIPVPEITFVFDELDKITGVIGAETPEDKSAADIAALDAERRRTYALRELMSDMKRLISSAPARFIFVGNRLLHDEWVADNTRRTPLLTSIFDEEVYLPSLLVDPGAAIAGEAFEAELDLGRRVAEYISRLYGQARKGYRSSVSQRLSPVFAQPTERSTRPDYPDNFVAAHRHRSDEASRDDDLQDLRYKLVVTQTGRELGNQLRRHLFFCFADFIAFRSLGNPKKMQQLIADRVRPAGRVAPPPADVYSARSATRALDLLDQREGIFWSDDVLQFDPDDIYRMQLVRSLMRHMQQRFGRRFISGDDKLVVSVLFMFDFLFKFHNRGFSWNSLERIEELAHIHKSPELRKLMVDLVNATSERFLHKVLNGMYSFRFRSDLAVEIRRLSRLFETEQAAFNFTLDESQTLKTSYHAQLERSSFSNVDVILALGELHEFDQEYDAARHYYRHAARLNDEHFFYHVGERVDLDDPFEDRAVERMNGRGPVQPAGQQLDTASALSFLAAGRGERSATTLAAIMAPDRSGRQSALVFAPWSVRRLRLMLNIGMTYEQAHDFEMAQMHYRDARKLTFALIDAFLTGAKGGETDILGTERNLLKHMNVFYQAIFAEAWVCQKLSASVDGSVSIVEKSLARLRRRLDFLKDPGIARSAAKLSHREWGDKLESGVGHSHFALIGAELHNKAGDLYFFKGRSFVRFEDFLEQIVAPRVTTVLGFSEGFVLRAHYHYCVALHEIRRFIVYRRATSAWKLNIWRTRYHDTGTEPPADREAQGAESETKRKTVRRAQWPDMVYLTIINNMSDIAETTLARASTLYATKELRDPKNDINDSILRSRVHRTTRRFRDSPKRNIERYREVVERFLDSDDTKAAMVKCSREGCAICDSRGRCEKAKIERLHVVDFLGTWNGSEGRGDRRYPWIVHHGEASSSIERIWAGLHFMAVGAGFTERSGYPEDAAYEYRILAETAVHYLQRLRIASSARRALNLQVSREARMTGGGPADAAGQDGQTPARRSMKTFLFSLVPEDGGGHLGFSAPQSDLVHYLLAMALHALTECDRLSRLERTPDRGAYLVGSEIAEALVTTTCGAILNGADLLDPRCVTPPPERDPESDPQAMAEIDPRAPGEVLGQLHRLLHRWLGNAWDELLALDRKDYPRGTPGAPPPPPDAVGQHIVRARQVLTLSLRCHPFPALNRVMGLKLLIDDAALTAGPDFGSGAPDDPRRWNPNRSREIYEALLELNRLAEQLQAPMHVTPMTIGTSATLYWLWETRFGLGVRDGTERRVIDHELQKKLELRAAEARRMANVALRAARESYTMGRAFRESIGDLYYLFDDFNDRRLHFNHSLQMSEMEVCSIFEQLVRNIHNPDAWPSAV